MSRPSIPEVQEKTALIDGVSIRYVAAGQGPAVVLIHGLAGCCHFWRHNLEPLGQHFSVYAPDLPGHGGSAPAEEYTLPYAARFVTRFLDHLGLPQASLVGNSLGGLIALETASAFPDRVERLVLVDSAGLGRHVPWSLRLLTVPGLGEVLAHPTRLTLRLSLYQMFYQPGKVSVAELWGNGRFSWQARTLLSIIRQGADLRGLKPLARRDHKLGLVRQPTLIVWGMEDHVFPVSQAHRAHQRLPGSRLCLIPGCGHLPQWEHPERFNQLVAEFLQGK